MGIAGRRYLALLARLVVIIAQESMFERLRRWNDRVADADAGVEVLGRVGRKASVSSRMREWMVRCVLGCAVGVKR